MTFSKDQILNRLKKAGAQSAAQLAEHLGMTVMGVRQHLAPLEKDGLIAFSELKKEVGRPVRLWALTEVSRERFPESYGELAVDMIQTVKAVFGDEGLDRIIRERTKKQVKRYQAKVIGSKSLKDAVSTLASLRSEEGYMAEWFKSRDGTFTLVENHCPICAAARACQSLCRGELNLFRRVLGKGVKVERTEHLLEGQRRCVYSISPNEVTGAKANSPGQK